MFTLDQQLQTPHGVSNDTIVDRSDYNPWFENDLDATCLGGCFKLSESFKVKACHLQVRSNGLLVHYAAHRTSHLTVPYVQLIIFFYDGFYYLGRTATEAHSLCCARHYVFTIGLVAVVQAYK